MKSSIGIFLKGYYSPYLVGIVVIAIAALMLGIAFAQPETVLIGCKSNPEAHLFSYDQKFKETTRLRNYEVGAYISKEFDQCERLSSDTYLKSNPHWVDMAVGANFSGIGRIGYVALDPDTLDRKDVVAEVSHDFVGEFTLDEKILIIKDQMNETGYFGSGHCACAV